MLTRVNGEVDFSSWFTWEDDPLVDLVTEKLSKEAANRLEGPATYLSFPAIWDDVLAGGAPPTDPLTIRLTANLGFYEDDQPRWDANLSEMLREDIEDCENDGSFADGLARIAAAMRELAARLDRAVEVGRAVKERPRKFGLCDASVLSTRTCSCLLSEGLDTAGLAYTFLRTGELDSIPGFGPKAKREVIQWVANCGFDVAGISARVQPRQSVLPVYTVPRFPAPPEQPAPDWEWDEGAFSDWQSVPPGSPGQWRMTCAEIDGAPDRVTIEDRDGELWATESLVGEIPVKQYHEGVTKALWKKA